MLKKPLFSGLISGVFLGVILSLAGFLIGVRSLGFPEIEIPFLFLGSLVIALIVGFVYHFTLKFLPGKNNIIKAILIWIIVWILVDLIPGIFMNTMPLMGMGIHLIANTTTGFILGYFYENKKWS